ncbi:hypothetical protein [Cohnella sp. GCM10012308]|uniref:hypothetical protein n=1 Tax=Cohnella sp. GCM10012308 TaxID=3317329 RepID=UPI003620B278
MTIKSTWAIRTKDGLIPAGEVVSLADTEVEIRLVKAGLAEWADGQPAFTPAAEDEEWPSADEFKTAAADRQKELLQRAMLEPASNAAERLKQYETFLEGDPE